MNNKWINCEITQQVLEKTLKINILGNWQELASVEINWVQRTRKILMIVYWKVMIIHWTSSRYSSTLWYLIKIVYREIYRSVCSSPKIALPKRKIAESQWYACMLLYGSFDDPSFRRSTFRRWGTQPIYQYSEHILVECLTNLQSEKHVYSDIWFA